MGIVNHQESSIRPEISPHKIGHDFKYQSRKDFVKSPKKLKKRNGVDDDDISPSPPPPPYIPKSSKHFGGALPENTSRNRNPSNVEAQQPSKNRSCNGNTIIINICTGWGALGVIILLALIIVPIVVTRVPKHNSTAPASNTTTATTTVIIVSSQATTLTFTTASTVVVTQTPTALPSATSGSSSSIPQPTIIPGPAAGYVSHGWANGAIQLFYQDPAGKPGVIYSVQIIADVWSTPVAIANDSMPGSTLSLSRIEYDLDPTDNDAITANLVDDVTIWRVIYVDKNYVLQALEKTVQYDADVQDEAIEIAGIAGAQGWYTGNLGKYNFKVSSTLYQQACTWYYTNYYYTDSNMDTYLYFDSAAGGMKKIGYVESANSWFELTNMPAAFSTSSLAIECAQGYLTDESVWVIDSKNRLQQYYYHMSTSTFNLGWTPGALYTGPVAANSSLANLNILGYSFLFFQTPNGSIMQLPITSTSYPAIIGTPQIIDVAQVGTRLAVSGFLVNPPSSYGKVYTFDLFYQIGTHILRQTGTNNISTAISSSSSTTAKSAACQTDPVIFAVLALCLTLMVFLSL